jgi:hypothetical protein
MMALAAYTSRQQAHDRVYAACSRQREDRDCWPRPWPKCRRCLALHAASESFHRPEALAWIERLKPRRAILTNMHVDLDYEMLRRELPDGIKPAYNGLKIELKDED